MQYSPVLPMTISLSTCYTIVEGEREKEKDLLPTCAHSGTKTIIRPQKEKIKGFGGYFFSPKLKSHTFWQPWELSLCLPTTHLL